ncbi:uncharacterized protein LOC126830668 [Patella vulgata]|uniref:uncharacterized protein LOC126830668 n=1 Tax=Patella vulgata TaxID=6465 RepID=UPI0021805AEE|nr:uncharacterized protein LOC126830668 [Patella vulgata]XP_050417046.1 uncharacterized protein LOC126830668 [Patella vulgata]
MAVDYSQLPDVVWVNIMKYLTLGDRYRLSLTCHHLHGYFSHPSLWNYAYICMVGGNTNFHVCDTLMSEKCTKLIEIFGHLFQNVHIKIRGHFGQLDPESKVLLEGLSENCRLQVLTLEVGLMISSFHLHGNQPVNEDLASILKLVKKAHILKELNITSWPMYPALLSDPDYNIFQVLRKNEKMKNLESLNMFWLKDCDWSERHPILPSPELTTTIILGFRNLKRLSLRSPMLSEELFYELISPGRTRLQLLQIFVTYSVHDPQYQMPDIPSRLWVKLKEFHPNIAIECTVMSRITNFDLGILLKPEMPLESLTILRHAKCDGELLIALTEKFNETLKSLNCYCDASKSDRELLNLAKKCRQLCKLVFHGDINLGTIMELADLREWSKLIFLEKNIKTENEDSDNEDDDSVIKLDNSGVYQLTSLQRFLHVDEERDIKLEQLKKYVSDKIGFNWAPLKAENKKNGL